MHPLKPSVLAHLLWVPCARARLFSAPYRFPPAVVPPKQDRCALRPQTPQRIGLFVASLCTLHQLYYLTVLLGAPGATTLVDQSPGKIPKYRRGACTASQTCKTLPPCSARASCKHLTRLDLSDSRLGGKYLQGAEEGVKAATGTATVQPKTVGARAQCRAAE